MSASNLDRMVWLDCLRLIAGVSIVGLHASSDISGQPFTDFTAGERIGPILFRSVVYTARTELFIIISLFLLMLSLDRRDRPYLSTLMEQSKRLLIPFAFWVVFFAFFRLIKADAFGYGDVIQAQLINPMNWIDYFLLGNVQYHMHFLPTLFGLVLFFPLYKIAVDQPMLGLIVLMCLFTKREIDVWIWGNLQDIMGFEYLVRGVKLLTYAGYGMVAASFYGMLKTQPSTKKLKQIFYVSLYFGILMFAIKLVYSHKVILTGNWQYNYNPAYWADFLMPIFLFGIFFGAMGNQWPSIISKMAPFSFGIYLVHPIFLDILEIIFWQLKLSPSAFVALKTIGAILGASLLVRCLSKIQILAWTVGLGPLPSIIKKHQQKFKSTA